MSQTSPAVAPPEMVSRDDMRRLQLRRHALRTAEEQLARARLELDYYVLIELADRYGLQSGDTIQDEGRIVRAPRHEDA